MKEPKYWAIFQIVIGNISGWQMSNRKLTKAEIDRIEELGRFSFDFRQLGLDFIGGHHVITGCHYADGTKEAVQQMTKLLNEKGSFFNVLYEGIEE